MRVCNRNGFSLIELITVLALMAIVLAITMPGLNNYLADCRLEAACLQLQQDIRSVAQDALVKESANYRINLYRSSEKYRVKDLSPPGTYRDVVLPEGVDLVWTNFSNQNFGDDVIIFNARGIPTDGGHISLRSERTGKFKYVIVTPITGRTRVSDESPVSD